VADPILFKWGKPKTLEATLTRSQGGSLVGCNLAFSLGSSMLGAAVTTVANGDITRTTETADLVVAHFTLDATWHSDLGAEGQHALVWQLDVTYADGRFQSTEGSALLLPSF
jgi:hypothetical protein